METTGLLRRRSPNVLWIVPSPWVPNRAAWCAGPTPEDDRAEAGFSLMVRNRSRAHGSVFARTSDGKGERRSSARRFARSEGVIELMAGSSANWSSHYMRTCAYAHGEVQAEAAISRA